MNGSTQKAQRLPQLDGGLFLTDAGLETDFVFNRGHDLPAFAAHTLLDGGEREEALASYFSGFLELACEYEAGFIIDVPTWRAQRYFAGELGMQPDELRDVNHRAVAFAKKIKATYPSSPAPIIINGLVGPRGDAYAPTDHISASEASEYHAEQMSWLAEAGVDMISALTITYSDEAIGIITAAKNTGLPVVMSFTVETNGRLPSGQPLKDAIEETDAATGAYAAYYMINCAHPDHFSNVLASEDWLKRIGGFRCNASHKSHAELDECETLDAGDPQELAQAYAGLMKKLPWANVFGGCCGTDLRHISAIAKSINAIR